MQRKIIDGLYYLCLSSGEQISRGYDFIGCFYNGLALIENDNKIGLIDESGNEILSPCIEYDTVLYPLKAKNCTFRLCLRTALLFPSAVNLQL
ncbi:MAG: WG repeat-containing protein [Clostridia bacterium]|nr:WG repeat-containing protein [Clostridia bacterium]